MTAIYHVYTPFIPSPNKQECVVIAVDEHEARHDAAMWFAEIGSIVDVLQCECQLIGKSKLDSQIVM